MSKHTIACTIVNNTSGAIALASTAPNSGTNLTLSDGATNIGSGVTCTDAFTASNSTVSGCGGSLTYTMPNLTDVLVIAYNTSVNWGNSYCVPMLQVSASGSSSDPDAIGCDAYYCTASNSTSTTENNGMVATITIHDA